MSFTTMGGFYLLVNRKNIKCQRSVMTSTRRPRASASRSSDPWDLVPQAPMKSLVDLVVSIGFTVVTSEIRSKETKIFYLNVL